MKRILIIFSLLASLALSSRAQEPFFQLPIVPDSITTLDRRTNYLLEHYWDFCDLKKAFSARQRMAQSFKDFIDLTPYGTADVVHKSVDKFIKSIEKRPDDLLFIVREAEANLYADTSELISDELFLPFAQAAAKNKKIDKAERQRYERLAKILENCRTGLVAPDFEYTTRNGEKRRFEPDTTTMVVLFFNNMDCPDCDLTRVRLDADINVTRLIEAGKLKVVAISPTLPDGQWKEIVESYPSTWEVGASPEVNDLYDIRYYPSFFILNGDHKLYAKNVDIYSILATCQRLAARDLRDKHTAPVSDSGTAE